MARQIVTSDELEQDVYELTTDKYVEMVLAVATALNLKNPVVMGCSIGGRAVLHLALRHDDRFRAAIRVLQSALYAEDRSLNDPQPEMALHRPDIHGGKPIGASMAGMIRAIAVVRRWETMWHYMQERSGIFWGDIRYYFDNGDLKNGGADGLAGSRCPIYLLSGEATLPRRRKWAGKLPNSPMPPISK